MDYLTSVFLVSLRRYVFCVRNLFTSQFAGRFLLVTVTIFHFTAQSVAQAPIIQPGIPGQPSRLISAEEASDLASIQFSQGDVMFMQGMISHHAQAMEMAALVNERTNREAVRLLAQRISLSQEDEISMMQDWLEDRDLEAPDMNIHHSPDYIPMPGMASMDDMAALEDAEGFAFDSLFLEFMIKHHDGALTMVDTLLDQRGSAQDSVLFAFTSDVTSDQTSEIERMDAMLAGFSPDPRVNLRAGFNDAGEASLNMELLVTIPKPEGFFDPSNPSGLPMDREDADADQTLSPDADIDVADNLSGQTGISTAVETPVADDTEDENSEPRPSLLNFANTDLTFAGNVLVAGNYHGFNAFDISNPRTPELLSSVVCPGGQGDVSIIGDLLILSVEQTRGRLDCGLQGVAEPTSTDRFRGIRIFDISDFRLPQQVGAVQTCRGSHTHTVVTDPDDEGNIYVYGSGTSSVRPGDELDGCFEESPYENTESALFRIDVIQIPLNDPAESRVVNRPFIFSDPNSGVAAGLWEGGDHGEGTQSTRETNQCHDITAYPEIGMAAGACSGNGILLDISDPVNPIRLDEVIDAGFAYWHSATFNNDGDKVLFTDEWGGGGRPRCRASDPIDWGADAIYDIVDGKMQFRSHYKMPAPQTDTENCVAHNGSLIPVPGRDIFVQAWYQGGISVIDFTDSSNPTEIAFFDRGPLHEEELILGGYWSAYWYDGLIYGTEIARGLDVLSLVPSDYLTANEIAAASLLAPDSVVNAQQQKRHSWPAEPVVARAYVDQLRRGNSVEGSQLQEIGQLITQAENALANNNGGSQTITSEQLRTIASELSASASSTRNSSNGSLSGLVVTLERLAERIK
ncbi:MAG TPA: DUF305 domain-containing protein [Porticoccaceae bacterium]|jgi:uncharacterized protein (DUF305 family)|nr:DUF305 domain-containing protein [Gammaproteobacteria bacterium]HIL59932.1 DUF305 domain-containing protein [Porticoccaceae bacterium]